MDTVFTPTPLFSNNNNNNVVMAGSHQDTTLAPTAPVFTSLPSYLDSR